MNSLFIFIVPVGIVLMFIYSFWTRKKLKNYYSEGNEERIADEQKYLNEIKSMIQLVQPDLTNKVIVNAQYLKSVKVGVQVTIFHSYVILLDRDSGILQLISYNPSTGEVANDGYFEKKQVMPVNLMKGSQTNYKFMTSYEKELIVHTFANPARGTGQDEYEVLYPQEDAYNELRNFFHLPSFHLQNHYK